MGFLGNVRNLPSPSYEEKRAPQFPCPRPIALEALGIKSIQKARPKRITVAMQAVALAAKGDIISRARATQINGVRIHRA